MGLFCEMEINDMDWDWVKNCVTYFLLRSIMEGSSLDAVSWSLLKGWWVFEQIVLRGIFTKKVPEKMDCRKIAL